MLVAKSGEVFYVEHGILKTLPSMKEYNEMIARKEAMKERFEIVVNGTKYSYLLFQKELIMSTIMELPTAEQNEKIKEYLGRVK